MPKRISNQTKGLIKQLYNDNLPVEEIARRARVSYSEACVYVRALKQGFTSPSDYFEHLAKQKGFDSHYKYRAKMAGAESYVEYHNNWAKKKGFASFKAYKKHLALQKGFESYGDYQANLAGFESQAKRNEHLAKKRGFASFQEYRKHLAQKEGFTSEYAYRKYLAQQKPIKPENQELSNLIKQRLKEFGKNRYWLAKQTGIPSKIIYSYAEGRLTPSDENLKKIYSIFNKTIETILHEEDEQFLPRRLHKYLNVFPNAPIKEIKEMLPLYEDLLSPLEFQVLEDRINMFKLDQIGKRIGYTAQNIVAIENKALDKIIHHQPVN
jgi:transcriptional regulator with XRE-family HTH domain